MRIEGGSRRNFDIRRSTRLGRGASRTFRPAAAITSSFVARAARERSLAEGADDAALEARLDARFDDLAVRFDRIESILREEEK